MPWRRWVAVAVFAVLIAQGMIRTKFPEAPSIATAISISLLQWLGYVIALVGPLLCVPLAILSARQRPRPARAQAARRQEPIPRRAEPAKAARDLYQEWKKAAARPAPAGVDTSRWNLALLRALEWRRLEELAAAYFRTLRFRVKEGPPGPDGGVDLRLYGSDSGSAGVLVQCKAWGSWKVGVKEIRELFGVMAGEGVSEGIFVTTSSFTDEAAEWARGKNITLIDGDDFLRKLRDLPAQDQAHILKLATSGDFTTPSCPSCRTKMVRRMAQGTGDSFWGCSRFPKCHSKIRIGRAQAAA
jgi:restriction system protein